MQRLVIQMARRHTHDEFLKTARSIYGDRFNYSAGFYRGQRTEICIICPVHGAFNITPRQHLTRYAGGCEGCCEFARIKAFVDKSKFIHGDNFDYSETKILGNYVTVRCKEHQCVLTQLLSNHLAGKGCIHCRNDATQQRCSLGLNGFLKRAREVHGDRYGYSKVLEYINEYTILEIECFIHGIFSQRSHDHLHGSGCPLCGKEEGAAKKRTSLEAFISQSKKIHGNRYGYDQSVYVNDNTLMRVFCSSHNGYFDQTPRRLLTGRGCKQCKRQRQPMPFDYYLKQFREKHSNKYQYIINSNKKYRNFDYIQILCPKHGIFSQRISNHCKHGCSSCHIRQSFNELKWLDQMGISKYHRSKRVYLKDGKWLLPDGFDPETNTVYLFHGDYYHGNPKKYLPCQYNSRIKCLFGELLARTKQYEKLLRDSGYTVVAIWEYDFQHR
jgi:hypothetical protein